MSEPLPEWGDLIEFYWGTWEKPKNARVYTAPKLLDDPPTVSDRLHVWPLLFAGTFLFIVWRKLW